MASSQHRPQLQLPIYWDEKGSSIFHLRHSAFSAAVPSFSGPMSCLPASEMALDQRGHASPEMTAHLPKVCPHPLQHAHSVMDSGPSVSPVPTFCPFPRAKRGSIHPLLPGKALLLLHASTPVSPPPPRDLVLATQHKSAQGWGTPSRVPAGGSRTRSGIFKHEKDLRDKGTAIHFLPPPAEWWAFAFFLSPCRTN